MGLLKYLFFFFLFYSCAKLSYITEQGIGQLSLEYNDIDATDFLQDEKQKSEHRHKVQLVLEVKKYFYHFFEMAETGIYDEVKILDQKAVTYLVIYSPKNKIEALETWFPLLGNFSYLGFFSEQSALNFKNEKARLGFSTYIRDVYAYSTLNHPLMPFDDNILSSFFYYQDEDLIELIFHELTHTILFVGDNISFNENLASFIAEKLRIEYLKLSLDEQKLFLKTREQQKLLIQLIMKEAKFLNEIYTSSLSQTDETPDEILKAFIENDFKPKVSKFCKELQFENCWPLASDWNNARFAALGTYSDKQERLEKIYNKLGLSLKDFVKKLIELEKDYNKKIDFLSYIEQII